MPETPVNPVTHKLYYFFCLEIALLSILCHEYQATNLCNEYRAFCHIPNIQACVPCNGDSPKEMDQKENCCLILGASKVNHVGMDFIFFK